MLVAIVVGLVSMGVDWASNLDELLLNTVDSLGLVGGDWLLNDLGSWDCDGLGDLLLNDVLVGGGVGRDAGDGGDTAVGVDVGVGAIVVVGVVSSGDIRRAVVGASSEAWH